MHCCQEGILEHNGRDVMCLCAACRDGDGVIWPLNTYNGKSDTDQLTTNCSTVLWSFTSHRLPVVHYVALKVLKVTLRLLHCVKASQDTL